jgi:hypothetical protein
MDQQDTRLVADDGNGREVLQRIVRKPGKQRGVDRKADVVDEQGMAVGWCLRSNLGAQVPPAPPRLSTTIACSAHPAVLCHDPSDDIVPAARWERHNEADLARRVVSVRPRGLAVNGTPQ